jgi:hypothetical protein
MFTNFISALTIRNALLEEVYRIRTRSCKWVFKEEFAYLIERTTGPAGPDRIIIHFVISVGYNWVKIRCDKHSYTTIIMPSSGPGSAKFTGRLKYTNRLTKNVVKTAYAVDRPWHLHGIPRNIENGYEKVMTVEDIAAVCQ